MSTADHAAKLPTNIQETSDAQARKLEELKVAAPESDWEKDEGETSDEARQ